MAACQSPVPGAECRVEKCPSSASPWRAPAHTEPPLSQYPLPLLGHFSSSPTSAVSRSRPQLLPVPLPVENNSAPNRRRRLCQINGMCCMPQITHTCSALASKPPSLSPLSNLSLSLSLSLSFSLYTLDRAAEFYGSCVLWQCERHRKERPCFLWCSCCCGPEEIRTQTHTHTHTHTHTLLHTHSHEQTNDNTDPCRLHQHPLPLHLPCRSASTWFGPNQPSPPPPPHTF